MVPPFYHLGFYSNHSLDDSYHTLITLEDLEKEERKKKTSIRRWEVRSEKLEIRMPIWNG
jgi:hypothetical protein